MKTTKKIILAKGESLLFLDYTIENSLNNDGLVLMKAGGSGYEGHLGNYGEGTKENIDYCKRDAVFLFMTARPESFAQTIVRKMRKVNGGTMHEYYILKDVLKKEKIKMPAEITYGDGMNCMIYFNGNPLQQEKEKEETYEEYFNKQELQRQIKNCIDHNEYLSTSLKELSELLKTKTQTT